MRSRFQRVLLGLIVSAACAVAQAAPVDYKIVTGSERGTYIQIGRDLAKFVGPAAEINFESVPSAGSTENVRRLRHEPGVKFALVQSDVYQAYLDQASVGNKEARDLIKPLRVILPLYDEEIYFVVRSDSNLNYVHEIKEAKISAGPIGSGTALTTTTLYRQMFGQAPADSKIQFQSNEEGLAKLVSDKSVDVVVIVAGQPAKVLAEMKPEARSLIKMLKVDPKEATIQTALKTYFPATVRASSYPSLLTEDLPSITVKAFLVTYDYEKATPVAYLSAFARSLCTNFPRLQAEGHPKWREVKLDMPSLGRGWAYYGPTSKVLSACGERKAAPPPTTRACSQQERVLALCK